jgi:hypothetical protein
MAWFEICRCTTGRRQHIDQARAATGGIRRDQYRVPARYPVARDVHIWHYARVTHPRHQHVPDACL